MLMEADLIIGHNIIAFDIPALQKVYPWFQIDPSKVYDTFVMARLYEANVKERDLLPMNRGKYPKALFGQQGLEAWGYRLGRLQGGLQRAAGTSGPRRCRTTASRTLRSQASCTAS
jgi:DNA polymerase-1